MSFENDPAVQSAARWFWWIAGLSLVNAVLLHAGSSVNFVVGLAMTTLASVIFAKNLPVAILLTGITVGFYFLMGLYGQRGRLWAFYLGLAVYVLDALIYMAFQDWMSVGFHVLATYFIFKGVQRVRELARTPSPAGA
jgi:hypothetical protein